MQIGSGNNGQLTFLDMVSLMSYGIGLQNLKLNVAQEDLDRQTQELDKDLHALIADNTAQTQYIVNRVAPYPIPAYTVPNPFGTTTTTAG